MEERPKMIVVMALLGFAFLAFIFFGIGYAYGDQAGFMRAYSKYTKEINEALDENERGISELRNWQKYGEAIHQRQIADIEAKHKLAIDNVITITKFYYQKERTIRESQHGHN
jgi:hypothetical protein